MPIVDNLKDKAGNTIYPRTITEAIADPISGENLNQMLDGVVRGASDESQIIEDLEEPLGDVVTRHETEINTNENNITDLLNYVGTLNSLSTEEKSNLVGAINEIDNKHKTHEADNTLAHGIDNLVPKEWGETYPSTLSNGWTGSVSFKANSLGLVRISIDATAGTISSLTLIATIPVGYRPEKNIAIPVIDRTNGYVKFLYIQDTGRIVVANNAGLTASTQYQGEIIYRIVQ